MKLFPLCAVVRRMTDDPDTMRARLDRLTELVELARQVPWEDHAHVERALHLISQALQKVAQARHRAKMRPTWGKKPSSLRCAVRLRKCAG